MFFGRKWSQQIKELFEKLSAALNALAGKLDQAENARSVREEKEDQSFARIEESIKELSLSMKRQDMAVEDLLDSWSELQDGEEQKKCQDETIAQLKKDEKELLRLVMSYDIQTRLLIHTAMDNGSRQLAEQMKLVEKVLARDLSDASITPVGKAGEAVNYELHEVLQAVETDEENRHGFVAQVIEPGYIRKGQILKKAKVSAYKLRLGDREPEMKNERISV